MHIRRRNYSIAERALIMSLKERLNKNESVNLSRLFLSGVSSYLNVYLPELKRSAQTVASVRSSLSKFIRFVRKVKELPVEKFLTQDCTPDLVREWLKYEEQEFNIGPSTKNRHLSALRGYILYLSDDDQSSIEVFIKLLGINNFKVIEPAKEILSADQVLNIIAAATKTSKGERNSVMLLLLYETAIRVSELIQLRIKDLDLTSDSPHILVFGKGKKFRRINLSHETVSLLKDYLKSTAQISDEDTPLFNSIKRGSPRELTPRMVQTILQKSADKARIDDPTIPAKVHPHMLRRSKATSMLRRGTPMELVSVLLGHSSTETTLKYAKYSNEDLAKAIEKNTITLPEEQSWDENDIDELIRACSLNP